MNFPFRLGDSHEKFHVLDRDPASEDLHGILEVRLKNDLSHAIDESGGRGMEDVQAPAKRA